MADALLDRILRSKRAELARSRKESPLSELERRAKAMAPPLNLSGALLGDGVRLIAEVKRASPAGGLLREEYDPAALAHSFARNGAAAISVLTETEHFQGSLDHLRAVREATAHLAPHPPLLRKDFLFDPYQLYEARAAGADAVLLIAAILDRAQLGELLQAARELWLQCLVEVHDSRELELAVEQGAEVIGINNRDLQTFHTDLGVTERLAPRVPRGRIAVSESGIHTAEDVARARKAGARAVLAGETLMAAPDPAARVRQLLGRAGP